MLIDLDTAAAGQPARAAPPPGPQGSPFISLPVRNEAGAHDPAVLQVIARELGEAAAARPSLSFETLGIDSFELLSMRIALEQHLGRAIPDRVWTSLETPRDILDTCASLGASPFAPLQALAKPSLEIERSVTLGMPQMALGGLSESWLFKELGDMHWEIITEALGTCSSELVDGNGERLYATFTRFKLDLTHPLRDFQEDEQLVIRGSAARYGAGILLGEYVGEAGGKTIRAQLMSSFSKRGERGSNKGLMKGQPQFPAPCPIPELGEKPYFMTEYRSRRECGTEVRLFHTDYRINPFNDINGVGLLYFAAYPMISDVCEMAYIGSGCAWARTASTISRDICYFANSDLDDVLNYQVRSSRIDGDIIEIEALISRQTDGVAMASLITRKALLND